jgi:uncharacterized protein YegL
MYTPYELQKIANKCSILANPYDYRLNNKIVLKDMSRPEDYSLSLNNYTHFINKLLFSIASAVLKDESHSVFSSAFEDKMFASDIKRYDYVINHLFLKAPADNPFSVKGVLTNEALESDTEKISQINGNAFLFKIFNSFGINLDYYLKLKNIDSSYQKTSNFFLNNAHVFNAAIKNMKQEELEALFTFSLHLKTSIVEELSYLFTNLSLDYHSLKQKQNVYNFLEDLSNKKPDLSLKLSFYDALLRQNEFLEVLPDQIYTDCLDSRYGNNLATKQHRLNRIVQEYPLTSFIIYYTSKLEQYLVYYIEILHIVTQKMSKSQSQFILDLFRVNGENKFLSEAVYNPLTNIFNPKVEEIIAIKDNALRFEEIRNYLNSEIVKDLIKNTCKNLTKIYKDFDTKILNDKLLQSFDAFMFPNFVAKFVMASNEYAIFKDAVKTSIILIEYAKKNKINLTVDYTVLNDDEKELLDSAESSETFSDPFANFNYEEDFNDTESLKPKSDSKDKPISLSTELDNTISNFKEKGHDFTLKEVKASDNSKNLYLAVSQKIKLLNSLLIKQIRDIKTYNQGSKLSGLFSGKIDAKNLYKYETSDNLFYNNKYEIKEMDLAFGIVLDASGSMQGDKITDGKVSMVLLHETLRALNINHSIIDHTARGNHTCIVRKYHDFKESKNYDITKSYAIMDIVAREGNNDAGALYYMEQALLKTQNKDKICIIFSDGQPTECSEQELKDQVKSMERKGIKVIGIGINLPEIAEYYTDYANGKNLNEMVKIITDILKQYVLNK